VTNEIAGFGGLSLFIYLFIIFWLLSELKIKCVIGFGRFVRILEDQWK